ncbi:acyl-CoA thioester hydrolase [Clostridium sp. P21]|uniref:Acyl-CoA thioester hydrolase n=1 Tax=Clostridium muellerianum TaxID=2716538 RepID=A0A7Y0EDX6_9CLOT|nr:acyl-CoA thioester hydrolase/BAAT C-terminal domain-containing protein [Clostridium muellerianum]NMM61704.1 acyl-CoA thioester hydrolase [Clostridium muellerianum]
MEKYRLKEIYGDFYENEGKPLVVLIGGSRPGLPAPLSEDLLNYLKLNYNVLLLAYFGVRDLNESLEMVPIEYFINAIEFIKEKYKIADNQVIVIGQSKGGEVALLLTNYMDSAITIALVAGCYVFQGLPRDIFSMSMAQSKSSWTFNNKELPYIKFDFNKDDIEDAKNKYFCKIHEKSIEKNFNRDAVINIDNYKGKVFFLSAENDSYWPSKKMSNTLIENSKNKNNLSHITLDVKGHYLLSYKESVNEIINYLEKNGLRFA